MSVRLAAAGSTRPSRLQRLLTATPGASASSSSAGPLAGCGIASEPPLRRNFANGQHYGDFFGGGFPGGPGQRPPPRGDDKFYKLLAVERGASEAEIKSAYKKKAMKHHPDRGGDEATFKEISRAYEVLSDAGKRQLYDQYGEDGLNQAEQGGGGGGGGPHVDPFDLFSQMFGYAAGGRPRGKPRTQDQAYDLQLSLEELYSGASRNVIFNRSSVCKDCNGVGGHDPKTCKHCNGTGMHVKLQQMGLFVQQVQSQCDHCDGKGYTIPPGSVCGTCKGKGLVKEKKSFAVDVEAGAQEGAEFRFKGQADEEPGHDTGDVVILVREKPHKTFQRLGEHLLMSKKVTLQEALCGFEFTTKFLNGEDLVVRSSPGQVVQPGDIMVVEEKGMPRAHGQRPGNLFVMLTVQFPDSIPPEAQDPLLQALGGKALPELADSTELTRKLNRREAETLKQRLAQQRTNRSRQSESQQAQCQQM